MDNYHETNSYIVSELPTPMWDDINVQSCLTCGTFADRIVEIDLWMSGGGSKSLLHKVKYNSTVQGVSKKGNPTLTCHCALITQRMNVIFAWS